MHQWEARVKGSHHDYDVTIHTEHPFKSYHCTCPAFTEYRSCKHIAATMLELVEKFEDSGMKQPTQITSQESEWSQLFVNHLKAMRQKDVFNQTKLTDRVPLNVEYFINIQQSYYNGAHMMLDVKIGEKRPYVVKSIDQLLKHMDMHQTLNFTSKFSFEPTKHTFTPEDEQIFTYLRTYINEQKRFGDGSYDYEARSLMLTAKAAQDLLPLLAKRTTVVGDTNYKPSKVLKVMDKKPPLKFALTKKAERYVLIFKNLESYQFLEDYLYLNKDNKFYSLTEEQERVIWTCFSLMQDSGGDRLYFNHEQMLGFLSDVVPELEKIGEVIIDPAIKDEIEKHPLQAKLYVDYDNHLLTANLEFQYGLTTFNPFKGPVEDKLLVTDSNKEQQIMYLLGQAQFVRDEDILYLLDEADQFEFYYQHLTLLAEHLDIFMTDKAKNLFLEERHYPTMTSDVDHDNQLLDIAFDFSHIPSEEIGNVLTSMKEKKKFHRLANGQFMPLETDVFQTINQFVERFDVKANDLANDHIHLPLYHSVEVDDMMSESNQAIYKQAFKRLLRDLKQPETREVSLPEGIEATLRDYQVDGFQWFNTLAHYGFGGVLADDMGLGKTVQAISYIVKLWEEKDRAFQSPALIVAPASLIFNWEREFKKFAPSLHVKVLYGTKDEREEMWQTASPDVWITSYPMVRQEIDVLKQETYPVLFLDEAQAIKNNATKIAKAVRSLKAGKRFALSGTPIENSLDELWSLFQVLMPGLFPAKKDFKKLAPEKIARIVRPFILRRVKQDVLTELPDRVDSLQYSELTDDQKRVYLAYLSKIQEETAIQLKTEGFQQSRMKILAGLTRLRQICCHPGLFLDNYEGESGKLLQLLDLIETGLANNHRLLIFSQFSSMLKVMAEKLTEAGYDFFYLDGQTKSQARVEMADRFNEGEKPIFLISLKAGGTGLNLTGADTVILYDLWWNPAVEEQAAGRAHRMGQKDVVHVHRLIAEGTIEEKIYQLQEKKRELIDTVIQPGETTSQSLSEEDIKLLLNLT
jgi:SNF2 family DNA or RNA helicase